jgi:hypothetical protein
MGSILSDHAFTKLRRSSLGHIEGPIRTRPTAKRVAEPCPIKAQVDAGAPLEEVAARWGLSLKMLARIARIKVA